MQKSFVLKKEKVQRDWHLIDLKGKTLGRVASEMARLLQGKNKPTYTPHTDSGDFVVALNADQLVMTGRKMTDKVYSRHSGHPGGFKQITAADLMSRDSRKVVEHAVRGMLPKNKLQTPRLRRLKVYVGSDHPHTNHFDKKEK